MAALTYKIGADTSKLKRGLAGARKMLGGFANFAKKGALAGVAAGFAGVAASVAGMKKAIDLGSELSDIEANTGIAAGQVLVLRQAFDDAGIGADKLQSTIGRMQRSIVDAGDGLMTQKRAFEAMGLSVDELAAMAPDKQFQAIANALAQMEDPTARAARAMQIFGRSGAELGALIADPLAFERAAETVGSAAGIFDRSAGTMDRAADLFQALKTKLSGFFAGMAEGILPVLNQALEKVNAIDWAAIGSKVGNAAGLLIEAFKRGEVLMLSGMAFKAGALYLSDQVIRGFRAGSALLGTLLPPVFDHLASKFTDGDFWAGIFETLEGVFYTFLGGFGQVLGSLVEALGRKGMAEGIRLQAEGYEKFGDQKMRLGSDLMTKAGDGKTFGQIIEENFGAAIDAAREEYGRDTNITGSLINAKEELKKKLGGYQKTIDQARAEAEKDVAEKRGEVPTLPVPERAGSIGGRMKATVTSLQRVGGAALTGALSLDQKRNSLLEKIAKNTKQAPAAVAG